MVDDDLAIHGESIGILRELVGVIDTMTSLNLLHPRIGRDYLVNRNRTRKYRINQMGKENLIWALNVVRILNSL